MSQAQNFEPLTVLCCRSDTNPSFTTVFQTTLKDSKISDFSFLDHSKKPAFQFEKKSIGSTEES